MAELILAGLGGALLGGFAVAGAIYILVGRRAGR